MEIKFVCLEQNIHNLYIEYNIFHTVRLVKFIHVEHLKVYIHSKF